MTLQRAERETLSSRAKAIGRVAFAQVRDADVIGYVSLEDGRKEIHQTSEDGITLELGRPADLDARPDEQFWLYVRCDGRKVLDLRWSRSGFFRVATYEPTGDWEQVLRSWPEPVPFE